MWLNIFTITSGCFEVENGKIVWPATHVCTTVAHPCEGVDQAFNRGGKVTRYCSSTGDWLDADYSQCSLKSGTNPFVHLYLTFYTGSTSHILSNLQNIIRAVSSTAYILMVATFNIISGKQSAFQVVSKITDSICNQRFGYTLRNGGCTKRRSNTQ